MSGNNHFEWDSAGRCHERPYGSNSNNERPFKKYRTGNQKSHRYFRNSELRNGSSYHNDVRSSKDPETDEFGREIRPDRLPSPDIPDSGAISHNVARRPTPPVIRKPSTEYMETVTRASQTLDSTLPPSQLPRKLLIFDLNGTLLRRSKRPARDTPQPPRIVYSRPYLPSLIDYLFHPSNTSWLDVMVWSSAQPNNVRNMVEKCFGKDEVIGEELIIPSRDDALASGCDKADESSASFAERVLKTRRLKAVWARDTLGLSKHAYFNKSLTIKDLEKPWAALEFKKDPVPTNLSSSDTVESVVSDGEPILEFVSPISPKKQGEEQAYSALSTLLVDDSPEKCILQPYNHLCVPEYDSVRWRESGLAKWREKLLVQRDQTRSSGEVAMESDKTSDVALVPGLGEEIGEIEVGKEAAVDGSQPSSNLRANPWHMVELGKKKALIAERRAKREELAMESKVEMDEIMLALVGILERIKLETNIASWVKEGGLWGGFERETKSKKVEDKEIGEVWEATLTRNDGISSVVEDRAQRLGDAQIVERETKSKKVEGKEIGEVWEATLTRNDGIPSVVEDRAQRLGDAQIVESETKGSGRDVSSFDTISAKSLEDEAGSDMSPSSPPTVSSSKSRSLAELLAAHRSRSSNLSPPLIGVYRPPALRRSTSPSISSEAAGQNSEPKETTPMWFDSPEVIRYWASKGRDALKGLEIKVRDGIEPFTSQVEIN